MTNKEFANKFDEITGRVRDLLVSKGTEYQGGIDDVFHNFRVFGEFLECSPEKALLGYLTKHLISVRDIVFDIDRGRLPDVNKVDEKILDSIAYLCLLHAKSTTYIREKNDKLCINRVLETLGG